MFSSHTAHAREPPWELSLPQCYFDVPARDVGDVGFGVELPTIRRFEAFFYAENHYPASGPGDADLDTIQEGVR